jgi:hypothetical protein
MNVDNPLKDEQTEEKTIDDRMIINTSKDAKHKYLHS